MARDKKRAMDAMMNFMMASGMVDARIYGRKVEVEVLELGFREWIWVGRRQERQTVKQIAIWKRTFDR